MLSPETHSAEDVVRLLALEPIPQEGGWFRRVAEAEPGTPSWSSIYALFTPEQFSALHRLTVEEVWCFQAGDPLESLRLYADGRGEWVRLGLDVTAGQRPQDVVRSGVWQGTRLMPGGRWALVSCLVIPAFQWNHFTLGDGIALTAAYPGWSDKIRALVR